MHFPTLTVENCTHFRFVPALLRRGRLRTLLLLTVVLRHSCSSRQRYTLAKMKGYTGISPLAIALLSAYKPRLKFLAAVYR